MPTVDELISPSLIVPIATFLSIAFWGWGIMVVLSSRPNRAEDRLERMVDRSRNVSKKANREEKRKFRERVAEAAAKLSSAVQPKDEEEVGKIRVSLLNAGFRHPKAVQVFLGLKVAGLLMGMLFVSPLALSQGKIDQQSLMMLVGAGGLGFYVPGQVLKVIRKGRQDAIFLSLPDALDLMVVCVESGLGFDAALRRVTTELAESCPVLCDELNIVNFQMQMGRARRDALRDLGVRTGVDDVRALAAVIIQAERFGSSIGQALRVQSDSMRTRRRQMAEEQGAKTAVKIMIPLVLFIFPGVFIVLVGPAAIKISETMLVQ